MEKEKAVKKMILSIRLQENEKKLISQIKQDVLPESFYPLLEYWFSLMYQVGWDAKDWALRGSKRKAVVLYDRYMNKINEYPSITDAMKAQKYSHKTIEKYIASGARDKRGRYWKYAELKK